jgi:hypothetical protein
MDFVDMKGLKYIGMAPDDDKKGGKDEKAPDDNKKGGKDEKVAGAQEEEEEAPPKWAKWLTFYDKKKGKKAKGAKKDKGDSQGEEKAAMDDLGGGADVASGSPDVTVPASEKKMQEQGRVLPASGKTAKPQELASQRQKVGLESNVKKSSSTEPSVDKQSSLSSFGKTSHGVKDEDLDLHAEESTMSDSALDNTAEADEDFADMQAESQDAQDSEVEGAQYAAEDREAGCINGGSPCTDASSEPENPFDAHLSIGAGVGSSGAIDIPSMLRSAEKRATLILEELEEQQATELADRETGRNQYRIARKANEKDFQDKMKTLDTMSAAEKKAGRARRDQTKEDMKKAFGNTWQQRQVRAAIRNNMTAQRSHARLSRIAGKKVIRAERMAQRQLISNVLKSAMAKYKIFTRRLLKARFVKNVLPKIRKMMSADIQGNLTQLDLAGGDEEKHGAEVVHDDGFRDIKEVPSMRFYLTNMVRSKIMPRLTARFKKMRESLWDNLDQLRIATSKELVSSVGAVPHVGETLSPGIPGLVDDVFATIKHSVNISLTHVHSNVGTKIIEAIANPVMDILAPKIKSHASLKNVTVPQPQELASMAKQSKLLETRSVLSNWGNMIEQARVEAAAQHAAIQKDAEDLAREVKADIKAENDLEVEVLEAYF